MMQAVVPEAPWYLPAVHAVHEPAATTSVKLPGVQSWQTASLVLPGIGLDFPAAHDSQADSSAVEPNAISAIDTYPSAIKST